MTRPLGGKALTDEQRAEMVRRYVGGERGQDLGREYGVSAATVSVSARKAGHVLDRSLRHRECQPTKKITLEQRGSIRDRALAGERTTDLAVEFGVSAVRVSQIKCARPLDRATDKPMDSADRKQPVTPPRTTPGITMAMLMAGR